MSKQTASIARANLAPNLAPSLAMGLALSLGSASTVAGDGLSAGGDDGWNVSITPYLWVVGMDGDMTVKGVPSEVSTNFSDILSNLDFAMQAHVEAWNGDWALFLDGTYVNLGIEGESGPIEMNVDSRFYQFEFGGLYRAATWSIGDGRREAGLELLAGGRYTNMKLELSPKSADPLVRQKKGWTDLIVGARLTAELSDAWSVILRGDVGGFGLSGDDDMAYNGSLMFGWNFRPDWHLLGGYRALHLDYRDGDGADEFRYTVTTHGPVVGVSYRF